MDRKKLVLLLGALIIAIGTQNAFVLRQGIRREHVLPVVAVCAVADALLIAAGIAGLGALVTENPVVLTITRYAGAAFLLVREHDLGRAVRLRAAWLKIRAGADHRVVAREVALDQVARGREARGAAVEAAEEQLHHLAGHLRGHEALGG